MGSALQNLTRLTIKMGNFDVAIEASSAAECSTLLEAVTDFVDRTSQVVGESAGAAEASTVENVAPVPHAVNGAGEEEVVANGLLKKKVRVKKRSAPSMIAPIPVDLRSNGETLSLRDFVAKTCPDDGANHQVMVTVFAYYLTKFKGLQIIKPGHLVACYQDVGLPRPTNWDSLFGNIKLRKGWVTTSPEEPGTVSVTPAGENFVEFDLPQKKK